MGGDEDRARSVRVGIRAWLGTLRRSPRPLSLDEYVDSLRGTRPPTRAQVLAFAEHVAGAHSWYKHLPQVPPGAPFHFFLNPNAGQELVLLPDGRVGHHELTTRGVHYSSMPTSEYVERFGHLDYECAASPRWALSGALVVSDPGTAGPAITTSAGELRSLPPEALAAGRVEVTGMIHVRSAWVGLYQCYPRLKQETWPEECGGQALRRQVMERIAEALRSHRDAALEPDATGDWRLYGVDRQLHRLLGPERERQRARVVDAVLRASRLVHGDPGE